MKLKPNNWPTEPGHYWVFDHSWTSPEMVLIERSLGALDLWAFAGDDNPGTLSDFRRDCPDALFSDRIPEPEVEP